MSTSSSSDCRQDQSTVPALVRIVRRLHGFDHTTSDPIEVTRLTFERAERHRMIFSLNAALVKGLAFASEELKDQVNRSALQLARYHARAQLVLSQCIRQFEKLGVAYVVYKGFAVERLWYRHGPRQPGDLDLVVLPEQLNIALSSLEALGARRVDRSGQRRNLVTPLILSSSPIEVHTGLFESALPSYTGADEILRRRQSIPLAHDSNLWTLSDEDHLLALLVHGFKHQWCRLSWILDIAYAIDILAADALQRTVSLARDYRLTRIVKIGLALACDLFDIPFAEELDDTERCLTRRYRDRLFCTGEGLRYKLENINLHLRGLEGARTKLTYLAARSSLFG